VAAPLDLKRIAELGSLIGSDLEGLLGSLALSMADSIEALERALAAGDLGQATQAAHSCRNDALIVGARQVLAALSEVEAASRALRLEEARAAFERVRAAWPATRAELERAVDQARSA
jgi:HPt (histidine-containing phosphotransfer) domain-containing protein